MASVPVSLFTPGEVILSPGSHYQVTKSFIHSHILVFLVWSASFLNRIVRPANVTPDLQALFRHDISHA